MKKALVVLSILLAFSTLAQAQTEIIAHRGYWQVENSAQNSIVALYKANEAGVYGSEFDVLITADGIPIVTHDDKMEGKLIEETPYRELRDTHLKNGEILPTLDQYLVHGKACKNLQLILEIKPHKTQLTEDRAVKAVVDLVEKHQLHNQVEYLSFSMNICRKILALRPEAKVFYLNGDVPPSELKKFGLSGFDYHYSVIDQHPEWIQQAKQLGLETNVWTVNNEEVMRQLIKMNVDYITTDNPVLLQELLKK